MTVSSIAYVHHIILLFFLCESALSKLCPRVELEDVDWVKFSNLNGTWYDIIDNPEYEYLIDCWDWNSFIAIGDGFAMNATQHAEGRPVKDHLDVHLHFLPNGNGTYTVNQTHKSDYASVTKESLSHKADDKMREAIDAITEVIFSAEYFFITDYRNYFIVAQCSPDNNLTVFIKNNKAQPDGQDIIEIWNLFIKHKEIPQEKIVLRDVCIGRKSGGSASMFQRSTGISQTVFLFFIYVVNSCTNSVLLSP